MSQQTLVTPSREYPQQEKETPSQSSDDTLLTVSEVARRLRVDATTVRRWISQGTLQAISLPHQGKRRVYRVRQRTLNQLLQPAESIGE